MKHVNEMKHTSGSTAWALIFDGHPAGRVIANWSDNPGGSVCSASVIIWAGTLKNEKFNYANIGKAGGYGYDKLSQAVYQCFRNAGVDCKKLQPGNGATRLEFETWGYTVIEVL